MNQYYWCKKKIYWCKKVKGELIFNNWCLTIDAEQLMAKKINAQQFILWLDWCFRMMVCGMMLNAWLSFFESENDKKMIDKASFLQRLMSFKDDIHWIVSYPGKKKR